MWLPFPPLALPTCRLSSGRLTSRFYGCITGSKDLALALLYLHRDANGSDATIGVYWVAL